MATRKTGKTKNDATTANLGFEAKLWQAADALRNDAHHNLQANCILANPSSNDSDWRGELLKDDQRRVRGPPTVNANTAWRSAA